ncbi:ribosome biogenesis factor YjgA [Saccharospirillum mangrovi]|uniref:ribosome biogenesis factor YjgA n=1 Tax=Saccharospirillum mangrovi TaxID=2161747 RepID=UPI000D37BC02|nr:ribosome biogenesis factor YjgA [Saccharospirillum mangrovi]
MSDHNSDFDQDDDIEWVSKTQMKKEMHRLQAIGERLLSLRADQLATVPTSEALKAAIAESRRITQNEARRRHLQFIGKLMRDEDIDGIQLALDRLDPSSEVFLREQGQAEQWRSRLLKDSSAEAAWFEQFPDTERQSFRALVRAARKEQPDEPDAPMRSGKNSKRLLQWIRDALTGRA